MTTQPRKLIIWVFSCALAFGIGLGMAGCGEQKTSGSPGVSIPGGGGSSGGSSGGGAAPGAPVVTFTVSANQATVTNPGTGGVTLTADVTLNGAPATGMQVTFTVMTGSASVGPVLTPGTGTYSATLTDTVAEDVVVFATARDPATGLSTDSGMENITFLADVPTSMSLVSDRSNLEPGSEVATLTVSMTDQFGNPVTDVVDMSTTLGQLASNQVSVNNGIGTNTLSGAVTDSGPATVTADYNAGTLTSSLIVVISVSATGQPHRIEATTNIPELSVAGSGGNTSAVVTVSVFDIDGNPIQDVGLFENAQATLTEAPAGAMITDGNLQYAIGETMKFTTVVGVGDFTILAGNRPGTIQILIEVTQLKDGSALSPILTLQMQDINIRSGPPESLALGRSNAIQDNGDGTLTHDYKAVVADQWNNSVPEGTAINFGQITNLITWGSDGAIVDCLTTGVFECFTAPGIGLLVDANDITVGFDTILIVDRLSMHRGGYGVSAKFDDNTLVMDTAIPVDTLLEQITSYQDLDYFIGNPLGGGVIQENSSTVSGVATAPNTYLGISEEFDASGDRCGGARVNAEVVIWAETAGKEVADADYFRLAWVAPTQVHYLGPTTGLVPGVTITFPILVEDSASPTPYPIPDLPIGITVSGGTIDMFTEWDEDNHHQWVVPGPGLSPRTNCSGLAYVTWTTPLGVTTGEITLSAGGTINRVSLSFE